VTVTRVLLGVDGGQTGTRALLADLDGNVVRAAAGAAVGELQNGLRELIVRLHPSAFDVAAACVGLTNVDAEDCAQAQLVSAAMRELLPRATIRVVPDRDAALAGATTDGHGIVVVAGGGAIVAGVGPRGERLVLSGYGYRIGEDGSAVDIGRHATAAALRGWEGRGPTTALTDVVAAELGVREPREAVAAIYGPAFRRSRFAALAPAVLDAADAGDGVAAAIVAAAAEELAAAAVAAAGRLYAAGEIVPVALTGGLLGSPTTLARLVQERILAGVAAARLSLAPHASAAGAVVLAGRAAGIAVDRAWAAGACASVVAHLG
jgi:N-acetylglucosamine kinase-like BadF-type ATPase